MLEWEKKKQFEQSCFFFFVFFDYRCKSITWGHISPMLHDSDGLTHRSQHNAMLRAALFTVLYVANTIYYWDIIVLWMVEVNPLLEHFQGREVGWKRSPSESGNFYLPVRQNEASETLYFEANALEHVKTHRFPVCLHRWFDSVHRLNLTKGWTQGWYVEPGILQLQQIGTLCLSLPCVQTLSHNVRELRQTELIGICIRSVWFFVLWLVYYGVYWLLNQSWTNSI